LPDVRAAGQSGAAPGGTVAEHDARVVLHPHPFVEVALGEAGAVEAGAIAATVEAVDD
jgi:hypothetical protein